jgi:hypothetical protein
MAEPSPVRVEAEESLLRMQKFDVNTLPREKELGRKG